MAHDPGWAKAAPSAPFGRRWDPRRSPALCYDRPTMVKPATVHQLHVLLHDVEPAVWRRLLVSADTSLARLHCIVQIAFGWSDVRGHHFVIRGKRYGGMQPRTMPESADLAAFDFRSKERFLYLYGFSDEWRHQVRFEGAHVLAESPAPPVCIAGVHVGPSDEVARPRDHADRISRRLGDSPWAERHYIDHILTRLAHAQGDETVRQAVGDVDAFALAVHRLGAHNRSDPNRFDRHKVNRKLRAFAEGNEQWREVDDDYDSGDD